MTGKMSKPRVWRESSNDLAKCRSGSCYGWVGLVCERSLVKNWLMYWTKEKPNGAAALAGGKGEKARKEAARVLPFPLKNFLTMPGSPINPHPPHFSSRLRRHTHTA